MLNHEVPNQLSPFLVVVERSHDRKIAREQGAEIIEKKPTIDRQSAVFNVIGRRIIFRIAQMIGKTALKI